MDWAGREQRGCSPEGSQRKASGKRWPAVVVSWRTQCCCPRWWQTGLWQPHWGRKWWPILPGYGDKKRLLEEWEWAQKWETGVDTRGHFYYNRKEIIFISHFFLVSYVNVNILLVFLWLNISQAKPVAFDIAQTAVKFSMILCEGMRFPGPMKLIFINDISSL